MWAMTAARCAGATRAADDGREPGRVRTAHAEPVDRASVFGILREFAWLACLYRLQADGGLSRRWVLEAASFAAQSEALRAEWPQAVCLVEKGARWVVFGPGFRCAASGLQIALRKFCTPAPDRDIDHIPLVS